MDMKFHEKYPSSSTKKKDLMKSIIKNLYYINHSDQKSITIVIFEVVTPITKYDCIPMCKGVFYKAIKTCCLE